ncbi:hypothetical protein [Pseudomonas simiae]|jgi:hypothetical protein|uniref:CdiI immunity protein domain-containing protein n=1 Tax=Pseudomonas simiae TaxID=321846 RepID=A0A1N7TXA7_9PSED|nr:hypothetical protein [Pseudomonas simiae]AIB35495.1 hypothetical protein PS417_07865 [Pseudomonas simiae]
MMYLQNIIRFCSPAAIRFNGGKYYFDECEFGTFIKFFDYVAQVYSFSETTTHVDWEFECLSSIAHSISDEQTNLGDVEFVWHLLHTVFFEDLGRNEALDTIMAQLYWSLDNSDLDSACNALSDYVRQAAGD